MLGATQGRKARAEPKKELGSRECWRGPGGGHWNMVGGMAIFISKRNLGS